MEYHFNNLDAISFQRLINGILVARFGEDIRMTPLRGADGGRDGETAPGNPFYEFKFDGVDKSMNLLVPPRDGRYLFQVKHHNTLNISSTEARKIVISEFESELKKNVLNRTDDESINYFFLVTNVSGSRDALALVDKKREELLGETKNLHADIWWQEQVVAYLDQLPRLWNSFPQMFAGGKVPLLAEITEKINKDLPRAIRIAIDRQYQRDNNVKFGQIELEKNLSKLFVDLRTSTRNLSQEEQLVLNYYEIKHVDEDKLFLRADDFTNQRTRFRGNMSVLSLILNEGTDIARKIIIEGGPGQGKSTITQMAVQIYREQILKRKDIDPEDRWIPPKKPRLPFRVELRKFAELLSENPDISIEEYLSIIFRKDSSGSQLTVNDIYALVEYSPILIIFDGLDEVARDDLRDLVISRITESIHTFEQTLQSDVRAVLTTRPPAIIGRREQLTGFKRFSILPMDESRISNYLNRWLSVQIQDEEERQEVLESFNRRKHEPHVQALARNPMQLSVLLHFVRLKREAFPDLRAELYRDYFQIVIERDVEKSPELRTRKKIVEALHQFIGFQIHALTEAEQADGTLSQSRLLKMISQWLTIQGQDSSEATYLFRTGQERLGLIVALKGEGEETSYGFEVQPIREYFAAAYINEQYRGNAHDVFPALVRRSYWREVALFLAGLRRPNEKADLLLRLKNLDSEENWERRQDGRNLALQLLQEGVFSQPRLVFSDAIEFIFDLLDPHKVPIQNEPKEMLKILSTMIKQSDKKRHAKTILSLLQAYSLSQDEYLLYRIFVMAYQTLDHDALLKEILRYQGPSQDLIAKVRLIWPISSNVNIFEISKLPSFWEGVSLPNWALWCWYAANRFSTATDLSVFPILQQYLLEQFASNPISFLEGHRSFELRGCSNWAVWRLLKLQRIILSLPRFEEISTSQIDSITFALEESLDTTYSGLDNAMKSAVEALIDISLRLIKAMLMGQNAELDFLNTYSYKIGKLLEQPGLISWLACRCAITSVQSQLRRNENLIDIGSSTEATKFFKEYDNPLWKQIYPFYKRTKREVILSNLITHYSRNIINIHNVPNQIRCGEKEEFKDILDLIAEEIRQNKDLPFDWLRRISFTTQIIRPLFNRCRVNLTQLLKSLGKVRFVGVGIGASLLMSDVKAILNLLQYEDDPNLLSGALIALSVTNVQAVANTAQILKLLQTDQSKLIFMLVLLGDYYEDDLYTPNKESEMIDEFSDQTKIKLMNEVANSILKKPEDYPLKIVSIAAEQLSENLPVNLPPLLLEFES